MDTSLKYRLLGAFITVLVVALVLPVVLDRSRQFEPVPANVPPMPAIPDWAKTADEAQIREDARQLVSGEAERALWPEDTRVVTQNDPALEQIPANEGGLDAQQVPVAWVVQIGAFADVKNANQLRDELRGKNYKAFTEHFPKEHLTRVYVGPELTRAKIESVQKNLMKEFKSEPALIKQWQPSR